MLDEIHFMSCFCICSFGMPSCFSVCSFSLVASVSAVVFVCRVVFWLCVEQFLSWSLSQLFCAQNVFRPCYLMFRLVSVVGKAFLFPFLVMFLYARGAYERLYRRFGYIESQDMFGSGHVVCV